MSVKELKRQLIVAICSVFVLAMALGSSTYAWLVNNAQVQAKNIQITTATVYHLLIKRVEGGDYGTWCNLDGSRTLSPVSTTGELQPSNGSLGINSYDNSDNSYDKNDIRFVISNVWNDDGVVNQFKEVGKNTLALLTDTDGVTSSSRMYYQDSVYLMAGQHSKIYFDHNSTGIYDAGHDTLIKFDEVTDENTLALMRTMRVGLMVTQYGEGAAETHNFFVYQLDDELIDSTQINSYTTTAKYNGHEVDGISYAAGASGIGAMNFASLTVDGRVPVITNCMADGSPDGLSTVYDNGEKHSQALAEVTSNEEIRVDIYLWMEGCDYDTTASNSTEFATSISGIQFGFCLGVPN